MIDLRHLRYFVTVAEHVSILRAAAVLKLKPQTVSHHIRTLEDGLGIGLFDRRRGGLELTPAGREFLERAHRILFEVERAVGQAGRLGRAEAGGLELGVFTSLASGRLRQLLEQHRRLFPGVEVFFFEGNRVDLLARLRERRLDLVFVAGTLDADAGVESLPAWSERLVAALPSDDPLAEAEVVRWSDLSRKPVLVRTWETGGEIFNLTIGKLAIGGCQPNVAQHVIGREGLLNLVGAGFGVTLVAESATAVRYPGVVFRPIAEDDARIAVSAAWLAENSNPAARRFISLLRQSVTEQPAAPGPPGSCAPGQNPDPSE